MADSSSSDSFDAALEISEVLIEDGDYAGPVSSGTLPEIDCTPLISYLGINDVDSKELQQIQNIWEYFSQQHKTPGAIVGAVRELEDSLANPNVGENRLAQLYKYVCLLIESGDIELEKKAYLKDKKTRK